jgi:hypothetical protein
MIVTEISGLWSNIHNINRLVTILLDGDGALAMTSPLTRVQQAAATLKSENAVSSLVHGDTLAVGTCTLTTPQRCCRPTISVRMQEPSFSSSCGMYTLGRQVRSSRPLRLFVRCMSRTTC